MAGPSRSETVPLGSRDSINDDLRMVRYHGGFQNCPSSDLDGTVALLRANSHVAPDLVRAAIELHLNVAEQFFATLADSTTPYDKLSIAAAVLEPTMYRSSNDGVPGIVPTRSDTALTHHVAASTVIGYENHLLRHLSGLVYSRALESGNLLDSEPTVELSDPQRRILRRAERHLETFIIHWDGVDWGFGDNPPKLTDGELVCLGRYLAFIDVVFAEVEDGGEGPILVLNLSQRARKSRQPESGRSWHWSDNDEFNLIIGELLARHNTAFLSWTEVDFACRVTRDVNRGNPHAVSRSLDENSAGEILNSWLQLCRCSEQCDRPAKKGRITRHTCPGHTFIHHVARLKDLLTIALEYGSHDEALRRRSLRDEANEWMLGGLNRILTPSKRVLEMSADEKSAFDQLGATPRKEILEEMMNRLR